MKKAYSKYIAALLILGSNGVVASYISLNSYEIVLLRSLIGSLFLAAILFFSKHQPKIPKNKRHLMYLIISGGAMGASWMFLYEAYNRVGVSLATLLCYCGPVIVMMFSSVLFHERVTLFKIIGIAIALIGMVCVNGMSLFQDGLSFGLLCGILSAVMYAVMVIFNKLAKSIAGLQNATYQLAASFVVVAIFTATRQNMVLSVIVQNMIPILILGVINTGIACYLYFSSIQALPVSTVAICGYLEPLSALIFSAIFLSERLMLIQIIGAIFILGGAAIGEYKRTSEKTAEEKAEPEP